MILLILTIAIWIAVYAFEAKHDLNYKTIDGTEKLWDAAMFAVLHIGYGLNIWYYTDFITAALITAISSLIRTVFHDGFINYFRRRPWCGEFTVDNEKDYWDALMVWMYARGLKPCLISATALIISIILYYIQL